MPHSGPAMAIESEMKSSYLDYAMSVIVSRAIPDLRDGLKPVHRRILYAMHETGNTHDKSYRKSARPVGDVMGKYHPHGDRPSTTRWSGWRRTSPCRCRSSTGRATSAPWTATSRRPCATPRSAWRSRRAYLLADIDKETVDFQPNYDGKDLEPTVLPARFPNMLVNGAGGIAVGMATNIPPHNLGEVIDATLALIENPELTVADLMEFVPAPDFPTGALILGRSGARKAYHEGRGSVIIRARTRIEEVRGGRTAIIVSEIPYQVNKATMVERIAELARDRKIEGIAHVQDESDRFGVRVVVELRRDATPDVVLNQLFRFTPLQTSFGCNMLALNGGRPEQLDLKRFLTAFIAFREEVVARRTAFELRKRPRAGARPLRPRRRRHQRRRGGGDDPRLRRPGRGARAADDPRLARRGHRPLHLADRRPLAPGAGGRHLLPLRDPGPRHPRAAPAAADRARGQGGDRRAGDARRRRSPTISTSCARTGGSWRSSPTSCARCSELFAVPRRSEVIDWDADLDDEDLIEREDMAVTVTAGGYIKRTPL